MKLKSKIAETQDGKFLVLENDGIGGGLLRGERWEPHFYDVLSALDLKSTVALDVGANIGANIVGIANAVGDEGIVFAFEPQRVPFQQLCGTIILNGFANVVAMQKAVGDRLDIVQLERVDYFASHVNIGNAGLGAGGEMAEMLTLDSLNLSNVSFIKMDVQGSETAVLRGARNLIKNSRPFLFLEVEEVQLNDRGSSPRELLEIIAAYNYDLLHIVNNYPVDFVAVPKEKDEYLEKLQQVVKCKTQVCRL